MFFGQVFRHHKVPGDERAAMTDHKIEVEVVYIYLQRLCNTTTFPITFSYHPPHLSLSQYSEIQNRECPLRPAISLNAFKRPFQQSEKWGPALPSNVLQAVTAGHEARVERQVQPPFESRTKAYVS